MRFHLPRLVNYFPALVLLLLSAGCATRIAVAPNAVGLKPSEVSILRLALDTPGNVATCFAVIFDAKGGEVRRNDNWTESLYQITVKPGPIEVVLLVPGYQRLTAYPRAFLVVEPGKTYDFVSTKIMNGEGVNVEYKVAKDEGAKK